MSRYLLLILLIIPLGLGSVYAFDSIGQQFLTENCNTDFKGYTMNSLHHFGWCSVIDNQDKQNELLERILIEEKMQTELLDQMNCYNGGGYLSPRVMCGPPLNYSGIVHARTD